MPRSSQSVIDIVPIQSYINIHCFVETRLFRSDLGKSPDIHRASDECNLGISGETDPIHYSAMRKFLSPSGNLAGNAFFRKKPTMMPAVICAAIRLS
jgi:hypothetical protein